jgi:hypothetical protein
MAAYFGVANDATTALYNYNTRGAEIFSIGGTKMQRAHRG